MPITLIGPVPGWLDGAYMLFSLSQLSSLLPCSCAPRVGDGYVHIRIRIFFCHINVYPKGGHFFLPKTELNQPKVSIYSVFDDRYGFFLGSIQ